MNLSLFDKPAHPDMRQSIEALWPHQVKAVAGIREKLGENRSTLCVMATGTGKTRVAQEVIDATPGRVLFLCHRDTLIQQAATRLGRTRRVGIEKAGLYADKSDDVVVGTVQSMYQPGRLAGFARDAFTLLVCDEAHRSVGPSWRKVIDHFETAKVLGITATPDRADRLALGQVFESVAFVYDILPAIADGVLCRLVCETVYCASMDLDSVDTVAGDLNEGQLDEQVVKALNDIVEALCVQKKAGDRRGLVFVPRVATAHALVGKMNAITPNCARAVDGGMVYEERNENMRGHRAGEFQWLVNVDVLTEGYDDPQVACIANARPTKSRVRLAQAIGRGTRIAPGKVDLLVLDFTNTTKRHKGFLVTPVDILGGKYPDDVREAAAAALAEDGGDAIEALERAQKVANDRAELARLQAEAARLRQHRAHITTEAVDPFGAVGIEDPGPDGYGGQFGAGVPASESQQKLLRGFGFQESQCRTLSKVQAMALITKTIGRKRHGFVHDPRWMATLRRAGLDPKPMRHEEARRILGYIWDNKPLPAFAQRFAVGATYEREIGEEG